jgi:outer membrane protein assembly factor BamD
MTFRCFLFSSLVLMLVLTTSACRSSKNVEDNTLGGQFLKAKKLFDEKDYYEAQLELNKLTYTSRATEYEDDIQFYLAECYYRTEQYILATDAYQTILRNMPSSPYVRAAYFQIGMCNYNLSPVSQLDQNYTERAVAQFQGFIETFPVPDSVTLQSDLEDAKKLQDAAIDDTVRKAQYMDLVKRLELKLKQIDTVRIAEEKIKICREKLGKKLFDAAEQYVRLRAYRAATMFYDDVIKRFADTKYYEPALIGKIESLIVREHWEEADDSITLFEERFPEQKSRADGLRRQMASTKEQLAKEQAERRAQ